MSSARRVVRLASEARSRVRPKDMYGKGGLVEGSGRDHQSSCGCAEHQAARAASSS
jgi:hypothetical protein